MGNLTAPTPDATTTTKGKASFSSTNFSVSSGAVSIKNGGVGPSNLATGAAQATVATSEGTTSNTFADLTTTTDSVTLTIGANGMALVSIYGQLSNTTANSSAFIGIDISGASTIAASDDLALRFQAYANNAAAKFGATFLYTGLTAGSTTFKMKYRATANTAQFLNRRIAVVPL